MCQSTSRYPRLVRRVDLCKLEDQVVVGKASVAYYVSQFMREQSQTRHHQDTNLDKLYPEIGSSPGPKVVGY